MLLCLPGDVSALCRALCSEGASIPDTKEDFPEPETPVTEVIQPNGKSTLIDCKLLCLAPLILILFLLGFFLLLGGSIFSRPLRYAPVTDSWLSITVFGGPFATTTPPSNPAPGPRSHNQSACLRVSSSCSTTISVLPKSLNSLKVARSRELSL